MPRIGDRVSIIAGMHTGREGHVISTDRSNSTYGVRFIHSMEEAFVSDWMIEHVGNRASPPFKLNDDVVIIHTRQRAHIAYVGTRANGDRTYEVRLAGTGARRWCSPYDLELVSVLDDEEDHPLLPSPAAASSSSSAAAAAAAPPAGRPVMMVDQPPAAAAGPAPVTPADIARYCDYKRTTRGPSDIQTLPGGGDNACPHCMTAAGRLVSSKAHKFFACKRCERKWDSNRNFPWNLQSIEDAVRAHPISAVSAPESGKTLTDGAPPAYSDVFTAQGTPKVGKKRKVDETASSSAAAAAQ